MQAWIERAWISRPIRWLLALLAPVGYLKQFEREGDYTSRLALMEDTKLLPSGPVWDYYCEQKGVPSGEAWLAEVKRYEATELAKRAWTAASPA